MNDKMTKEERELVNAALAEIASNNGGILKPDDVVDAAKDPESPLHRFFTWDMKSAARERWIDQARVLIRSVRVVVKTEKSEITTVCYVRDPDADSDAQGYVPTISLIGDVERSRIALLAEFSRAAGALRRARELAVAFEMAGEIDAIAETVQLVRTKVVAHVTHPTQQ